MKTSASTTGEAIKARRELIGMTQNELAEKVGISRQAISAIESGKNEAKGSTLRLIESVLDNALDENGATRLPSHNDVKKASRSYSGGRPISSSLTGLSIRMVTARARAGFAESFLDDTVGEDLDIYPTIKIEGEPDWKEPLAFEVGGDSMDPELKDGSVVICTPVPEGYIEYASGGIFVIVYVINGYADMVVKRIRTNDLATLGTLTLHSENPDGGTLTIKRADLKAMWRVRRSYRDH